MPGLGDKIKGWLEYVFALWKTPLWQWLAKNTTETLADPEVAKAVASIALQNRLREISSKDTLTGDDIRGLVADIANDNTLASYPIKAILAPFIAGGYFLGLQSPSIQASSYLTNRLVHPARIPPDQLARGWWMKVVSDSMFNNQMEDQGVAPDSQMAMLELARNRLMREEILTLWLRREISESEANELLTKIGFAPQDITFLKKLTNQIPGSSDIISMAVREAWDDNFAAKWGTDQLFPAEFGEWMEKQGYSPEWAKRYWRAHWVLPSVQMGFEMFQRGYINETELRQLLKAQDIMPGYQEPIIQIAYLPYTRVDVRRMYGMGILDRAEVKRAYMDLGYNEERAENLTQFTVLYETEGDRELAKADILDGYKRKMISFDVASQYLMEMGYPEENAHFLLARIDLQLDQQVKDETLTAIKANYVAGIWALPETVAAMGKLALPATEEHRLLDLWEIERERRIQRPSLSYLIDFFTLSIITEAQVRTELDHQGYSNEYIEWFVNAIESKKREKLEKEAEAEAKRLLAQTKSPSKVELAVWWTRGFITENDMRNRMAKIGYLPNDIENYIKTVEAELEEQRARESEAELRKRQAAIAHPTKTDLKVFYQRGLIDEAEFRSELAAQGFEAKWIDRYILSAQPEAEEEEE